MKKGKEKPELGIHSESRPWRTLPVQTMSTPCTAGPPLFAQQLSTDPIPAGYRMASYAEAIETARNKVCCWIAGA